MKRHRRRSRGAAKRDGARGEGSFRGLSSELSREVIGMDQIRTEAWVLEAGVLRREDFVFHPPAANEVIAEPIFGCWEGNMTHALRRDPIDVNKQRSEKRVVLGNAGVVRVVDIGKAVRKVHPGDYCVFMPSATV